jgi:hypothetical protein
MSTPNPLFTCFIGLSLGASSPSVQAMPPHAAKAPAALAVVLQDHGWTMAPDFVSRGLEPGDIRTADGRLFAAGDRCFEGRVLEGPVSSVEVVAVMGSAIERTPSTSAGRETVRLAEPVIREIAQLDLILQPKCVALLREAEQQPGGLAGWSVVTASISALLFVTHAPASGVEHPLAKFVEDGVEVGAHSHSPVRAVVGYKTIALKEVLARVPAHQE